MSSTFHFGMKHVMCACFITFSFLIQKNDLVEQSGFDSEIDVECLVPAMNKSHIAMNGGLLNRHCQEIFIIRR